MNKINLQGISAETISGILILLLALANAVLQIFHINILPVTNDDAAAIASTLFLIITTLWNTWKNRNLTSASQIAQNITDAIKSGEILEQEITDIIHTIHTAKQK